MRIYKNLVQRLEEEFLALEKEAIQDLKDRDLEYALLVDEIETLMESYPFLKHYMDGACTEPLSKTQQEILAEYQNHMRWKDIRERRYLYFLGHADAVAYYKKVGGI